MHSVFVGGKLLCTYLLTVFGDNMAQGEGGGRPTKFTPERCAAIIDDISHHVPYQLAAEANGICQDTLYEWIKKGVEDRKMGIDSDFSRFSENVKGAERTKIREHTGKINENVERWQADAWLLERRWYKHFGANAQLNEVNAKLDKLLSEKDDK